MFNTNTFIDTIQFYKMSFVNNFISDPTVASELREFVTKQTSFVKQAVKTFEVVYENILRQCLINLAKPTK